MKVLVGLWFLVMVALGGMNVYWSATDTWPQRCADRGGHVVRGGKGGNDSCFDAGGRLIGWRDPYTWPRLERWT